jgi:hypothetical protein
VLVSITDSSINSFLARLRRAVAQDRLQVRGYAREGLRDLEWTIEDLKIALNGLTVGDFHRTERSTAPQGGLIWVFTPERLDEGTLWVRLVERAGIVVISFHQG